MRRTVFLSLLLVFLFAGPLCPAEAQATDRYLFLQDHSLLGPLKIYTSQDGIKVSARIMGFTLISRKPDWSVTIYSTRRKKVFKQSFDSFMKAGLGSLTILGPGDQNSMALKRPLPETHMGLPASKHRMVTNRGYYIVTDAGMPDRKAGKILQQLYNVPYTDGIPLVFIRERPKQPYKADQLYFTSKHPARVLSTLFVKKNPSKGDFDLTVPPGLKTAMSEREVVIGKSKTEGLEEILTGD